ncbi:Ervl/Alr family protein [Armadillidium vulgare iridescent virus]|uniref:Sulfhydryl oxidase n=1 Tax=Armadillidium vulgare iridescent virus TaxID=72201 RepID=A0A068QK46_9VIRU|nr:Ervl/Alr family protein [Armadillidium vulgare iridescent virus]CCV02402.1 Ervl/Alr family protein [Armadillidium vulgare iridescent virus]
MNNDLPPNKWGPSYWFTYHTFASTYPVNPTPIVMDAARAFIKIIPYTLPCVSCTDHAFAFIQQYINNDPDLIKVVGSRITLFKFFFDFHNSVNYRLNKPIISFEDARQIWSL